jgi:FkbM family methyltransferase
MRGMSLEPAMLPSERNEALYGRLLDSLDWSRQPRAERFRRSPLRLMRLKLLLQLNATARMQVPTFFGGSMMCVIPDHVAQHIVRDGHFEPDLTFAVLALLGEAETFVDVGAHFGYFSLLARQIVGPKGKVVAFEPTPRTRAITLRNIRPFDNVAVEPLAAWSGRATISFNDYGWPYAAYNSYTAARLKTKPLRGEIIRVDTIDLDSYFEERAITPSFIKVDAESAEMQVLQGLTKTMRESSPVISLEVGDRDIEGVPLSRELIAFAARFGYVPFEVNNFRLQEHTPARRYKYGNLILSKQDLDGLSLNSPADPGAGRKG